MILENNAKWQKAYKSKWTLFKYKLSPIARVSSWAEMAGETRSCNIPTDICKFPAKKIPVWISTISILPWNFPKMVWWEKVFKRAKIYGAGANCRPVITAPKPSHFYHLVTNIDLQPQKNFKNCFCSSKITYQTLGQWTWWCHPLVPYCQYMQPVQISPARTVDIPASHLSLYQTEQPNQCFPCLRTLQDTSHCTHVQTAGMHRKPMTNIFDFFHHLGKTFGKLIKLYKSVVIDLACWKGSLNFA